MGRPNQRGRRKKETARETKIYRLHACLGATYCRSLESLKDHKECSSISGTRENPETEYFTIIICQSSDVVVMGRERDREIASLRGTLTTIFSPRSLFSGRGVPVPVVKYVKDRRARTKAFTTLV